MSAPTGGPGRTRRTAIVVLAAAVPACVLLATNRWAAEQAEAGEPLEPRAAVDAGAVTSPLLSSRRLPTLVRHDVAVDALATDLAPVGEQVGTASCLTVAVDGAEIYDQRGAGVVVPASNMKLLVAAVALERLGPDFTWTTDVRATGRAGSSVGDLFLVGGGDPLLGTAAYLEAARAQEAYPQPTVTSLETLADRVVAAGITRVDGRVIGDESRYDQERYVPSWPESYRIEAQAGPLSALHVNDAFSSLTPLATTSDPAVHGALVFTELLRQRGVEVVGGAAAGAAPPDAASVAVVQSAPLREVVGELLTTSDNNTAELVVKELGRTDGAPGSRAAGLQVVGTTLADWGLATDGLALVDGSGLDRGNRVTCDVVLGVLRHVGPDSPLVEGLPLAGRTGTLTSFFRGSPAEARLRGKTGTLRDARALSGYVDAVDGSRPVAFSYIENGDGAFERATAVWTRLGETLTQYPEAPTPAELGPLTPATLDSERDPPPPSP